MWTNSVSGALRYLLDSNCFRNDFSVPHFLIVELNTLWIRKIFWKWKKWKIIGNQKTMLEFYFSLRQTYTQSIFFNSNEGQICFIIWVLAKLHNREQLALLRPLCRIFGFFPSLGLCSAWRFHMKFKKYVSSAWGKPQFTSK